MKAFEVAKVSKMDKNDYILYQISKSKKYDLELVEEGGVEKGIGIGADKTEVKNVLAIHSNGFSPQQIANMLNMPLERVLGILKVKTTN